MIFFSSLGAWQFLADMPFNSVSTASLWVLFWALHTNLRKGIPVLTLADRKNITETDWRTKLQGKENLAFLYY